MKLLLISTLFFLQSAVAFAQETFPVITDYPSMTGSQSSIVLYYLLNGTKKRLTREARNFNAEYNQRSVYLISPLTGILTAKINEEMAATLLRYQLLNNRNNELSIFHYSQKKKNKKVLDVIQRLIVNLKNELDNQHSTNVLLGEKMNLYQNAMSSINKIHRKMDLIDDTIDRSLIINRILGRY